MLVLVRVVQLFVQYCLNHFEHVLEAFVVHVFFFEAIVAQLPNDSQVLHAGFHVEHVEETTSGQVECFGLFVGIPGDDFLAPLVHGGYL